ncbi:MAG: PAS domain-containing sensor histidine kinase [Armatimonadota bacterium]|nr:PAS domain-containing sensor histidine kinase [Armatimonadota bacterium]
MSDPRRLAASTHEVLQELRVGCDELLAMKEELHRHSEAAVQASENRFRVFMDNTPALVFIKDEDGRYVYLNRALERFIQTPAGELLGKTNFDRLPEETARQLRQNDLQVLASGQPQQFVEVVPTSDGRLHYEIVVKFPLTDDNGRRLLAGVAIDFTERKQAEEELARSREQLRALAAHLETAIEAERTHIAREIHDHLGQALTGLKMDLGWLSDRLPSQLPSGTEAPLHRKIQSMSQLIDGTIQAVRQLSSELRPAMLDDLGLEPAIEWQVQHFQDNTGIACAFTWRVDGLELDRVRATALFRILQEALTNIARHAGASHVDVRLQEQDGALLLEISDDGCGIKPEAMADVQSLGLVGMRERAHLLGGHVQIRGRPGLGTSVVVTIPLCQ